MATARQSRRSFLHFLGLNGVVAAAGACAPAASADRVAPHLVARTAAGVMLRLDSNENSSGPGPRVLSAIQEALGEINRYAFGASRELVSAIAGSLSVQPHHIELGCGSTEILEAAVTSFTAPDRGLVTAAPLHWPNGSTWLLQRTAPRHVRARHLAPLTLGSRVEIG